MTGIAGLTLAEASGKAARRRVACAGLRRRIARAASSRPTAPSARGPIWMREAVRSEAKRLDGLDATTRGPLHGIPVGLKDIIHTRSLPTRMGSTAFEGFSAPADAVCVQRLVAAGAYAFGKTVTTELAFMHPGKTRNPWNAQHTPGGSSQGSAAAVAAGHVPAALGTQTNGSVIRPAAYCGVVGFKPTPGRDSVRRRQSVQRNARHARHVHADGDRCRAASPRRSWRRRRSAACAAVASAARLPVGLSVDAARLRCRRHARRGGHASARRGCEHRAGRAAGRAARSRARASRHHAVRGRAEPARAFRNVRERNCRKP